MSEDLPEGKSLILLRTRGHVYWSELEALCPGVRGHRGVKGWAEGKKNVGNRNQSIWALGEGQVTWGFQSYTELCTWFWENEDHLRAEAGDRPILECWLHWQVGRDGRAVGQTARTWCEKDNVLPMGVSLSSFTCTRGLRDPEVACQLTRLSQHASFSGKVSSLWLPITTPVAKCPPYPLFQACHKMGLKGV